MASSFDGLRTELLESLATALAGEWWVSREAPLDEIVKPTLYLQRDSLSKSSAQGFLINGFSIYLAWPRDTDEDRIDEDVETAIQHIDANASASWQTANRILFADSSPGWQFDFTALSTRKPDTPPIE